MKAILLINFGPYWGGTHVRYITLFEEIRKNREDYFLFINDNVFQLARENGFLVSDHNVVVMNLRFPKKKLTGKQSKGEPISKVKGEEKVSRIRRIGLGARDWLRFIRSSRALYGYLKRYLPAYIYSIWTGGVLAWPLKYLLDFKLIYSYNDSGFASIYPALYNPLKNERLVLQYADAIDFLSQGLIEGVKSQVNIGGNQHFVSPGSFKDYKDLFAAEEKHVNRVVFCGRLEPIKNPLLFVEAIWHLRNKYPDSVQIEFIIVGNGSLELEVRSRIQKYGLQNVSMVGAVPSPKDYFKESIVFVSIQQTNNYPSQALIEAMACENAIVASDVGETFKLVNNELGERVALDAEQIGEAIYKLWKTPEQSRRMGRKARELVLEKHSIQSFMNYFLSLHERF